MVVGVPDGLGATADVFTVTSEMNRTPAISALLRPAAISRSTSASRGVRSSGREAGSDEPAEETAPGGEAARKRLAWTLGSSTDCPAAADRTANAICSRPASLVRKPKAPASSAAGMLASSAIAIFLVPVTFYVVEKFSAGREAAAKAAEEKKA